MGLVIAIVYFIGMLGSIVIGRARAGLTQGRLSVATMFSSIEWTTHQLASALLWPAFLLVWLLRGRPESQWRADRTRGGTLKVRRARVGE